MKNIPIIDLKPQYEFLKNKIDKAVAEVIHSTKFIMGPEVKKFEKEAASYLGVKHAIGVNSGTDALVISLLAAGVKAGDEVITSPYSFFATAESISKIGANPVFCDIDPVSYNINPDLIEELISERTRAIMPVHLFGNPAEMDKIKRLAEKYNLKIIEDCAQSFGARYINRASKLHKLYTGTIGDAGVFSFFPTKNLGAYGDGGLIATNDDSIAELACKLRSHGSIIKYHNELLGFNSRLDSIQAAILRIKLPYVNGWNTARRFVAELYNHHLSECPGIVTPEFSPGCVFHQYTVRVLNGKRKNLKVDLSNKGVSTMIYYPVPQDKLPVFDGQYPEFENSCQLSKEALSLPLWPEIDEKKIEYICDAIKSIMREENE